jgi:hypothetical protein
MFIYVNTFSCLGIFTAQSLIVEFKVIRLIYPTPEMLLQNKVRLLQPKCYTVKLPH